MIRIAFVEPVTAEWQEWVQDCDKAQTDHDDKILRGEPSEANGSLYGRLKKTFYLDPEGPFHGKCAFCEDFIRASQHGDIEHFRPKGAIVDLATNKKLKSRGTEQPHPGYYWLAYDWRNLLPACQLCNQPSTEPEGKPIGKRNYFPLADEAKRAQKKGEENAEEPLLINPVMEDPEPHLGIDGKTGVMFARNESPKGNACIKIFGLNLRDLPDQRSDVYDKTRILYKALIDARYTGAADLPRLEQKFQRILEGRDRFAAAARLAVTDVRRELLEAIDRL